MLQGVTGNIKQTIRKLKQGGFVLEEAKDILKAVFANNGASKERAFSEAELLYTTGKERALSERLNEYIDVTHGYFSVTDCDRELHIVTTQDKTNRRQVLHRLCSAGILRRHPRKNGLYRRIEDQAGVMDWKGADISKIVRLHWPFNLEDYCLIYPRSIIIIAGEKEAGKTALLLDFIRLNMKDYPGRIHYFNSETGPEELQVRLSKFEDVALDDWNFDAREKSCDFADVIYPDDINLIDYLEVQEGEFFKMGDRIREIWERLRNGIAIIAMQKNKGAEYAKGAGLTAEKAKLYLTMEKGKLRITHAKNWAVEGENPNGMEWNFKLVNGARFILE